MAFVSTDWTIDRATKNIRYIGDDHGGSSPSYATVLQFHQALQDFADNLTSSGDDQLSMVDTLPSDKQFDTIITLINGYNIDDASSEHLYGGSIIQNGGDIIYDGFVNFGNADVQIQIIQNGAVLSDDWWNFGGGGLNADANAGISHQFLLKVRDSGADIDGRRIIATTRVFGKSYSEFTVNGSGRGNNTLALSNSDDLNNQSLEATIAAIADISNNNEGYVGIDVNNDSVDEFYYSEWDRGANTINAFYEYAKYLTRDGSAETLYGLSGELFRGITHEINIDTPTGTFTEPEALSWIGGTGQLLAINSTTAGTKMWIQLLTGVAPTNNQTITGATSSATADVNLTVISRTVSPVFVGQSTGSAIIGSFGLGIESADLSASDSVIDLSGATITPPNNVTFTVSGLVSTEDTVLVAPYDGVSSDTNGDPAIEKDQLSLDTSLTTDNITSVVVATSIPSDTPSTGTIRVIDDDGFDRRLEYSSWSGSTFTISSTDGQEDFGTVNATAGNNVYITYLDKVASASSESFSVVYSSDRDLVIIVRDGGVSPIKQFITTGSIGSAGGSVTAIRTSDS